MRATQLMAVDARVTQRQVAVNAVDPGWCQLSTVPRLIRVSAI